MQHKLLIVTLSTAISITACQSESNPLTGNLRPDASALKARGSSNATATWQFPLSDEGLSVKSDHQFVDGTGTYSTYANGTCTVSSTIFYSGSGDNTIQFSYPKARSCGRTWTVVYPDGYTETLAYQGGVQVLEDSNFAIPVGHTVLRHFRFGTGNNGNPLPARCGQGLVFGPNGANAASGSDSVAVTRVDASTWDVQSQPAPSDRAYCIDNGQLYEMQIRFRIVSSLPLP